MEVKNKACWNCHFYKAYYIKGFCHFDKQEKGVCKKNKEIIDDKHTACSCWIKSENYYAKKRKIVCLRELQEMLQQISEIKQILFKEKEFRQ